jgi:hypothetical protein
MFLRNIGLSVGCTAWYPRRQNSLQVPSLTRNRSSAIQPIASHCWRSHLKWSNHSWWWWLLLLLLLLLLWSRISSYVYLAVRPFYALLINKFSRPFFFFSFSFSWAPNCSATFHDSFKSSYKQLYSSASPEILPAPQWELCCMEVNHILPRTGIEISAVVNIVCLIG